jgi:paraquat-inducible protein A
LASFPHTNPHSVSSPSAKLIACRECGQLQRETELPPGGAASCCRCGALLYRNHAGSLDRPLALLLAAAIVFVLANAFPIVGIEMQGNRIATTLYGAVQALWREEMHLIAGLVLFTTILAPAFELGITLAVLALLYAGSAWRGLPLLLRLVLALEPWSMIEVFMLGVLVAVVKLSHSATIVPGIALWAYAALMVLLAAATAAMNPHALWDRIPGDVGRNSGPPRIAPQGIGLRRGRRIRPTSCPVCGLVCQAPDAEAVAGCPRCGAALHPRKPDSVGRTWALLIAAYILFLPSNLLPIMLTTSLTGTQRDTILSGVVYLWLHGSWPLAALVFFASIVVPLVKLVSLTFLLASVQRGTVWRPLERARLYRLLEFIGRWSMLDIYVITILSALVQMQALAQVSAGPGAIAFGAVVVLTMLASKSFDPRLIWDPLKYPHG